MPGAETLEKLDDGRKKAMDLVVGDMIKGDHRNQRLVVIQVDKSAEDNRVAVRWQDDAGNTGRKYFNYDHMITVYPAPLKL